MICDIKKRISSFGNVDCNLDIKQDELKEIIHDYDILIVPTHLEFDKNIWKNDSNIKVMLHLQLGVNTSIRIF